MTDKILDQARGHAADLLASLRATLVALESTGQAPEPGSPRANAIQAVQSAVASAEALAHNLGGVPLPVQH